MVGGSVAVPPERLSSEQSRQRLVEHQQLPQQPAMIGAAGAVLLRRSRRARGSNQPVAASAAAARDRGRPRPPAARETSRRSASRSPSWCGTGCRRADSGASRASSAICPARRAAAVAAAASPRIRRACGRAAARAPRGPPPCSCDRPWSGCRRAARSVRSAYCARPSAVGGRRVAHRLIDRAPRRDGRASCARRLGREERARISGVVTPTARA